MYARYGWHEDDTISTEMYTMVGIRTRHACSSAGSDDFLCIMHSTLRYVNLPIILVLLPYSGSDNASDLISCLAVYSNAARESKIC